ncbi:MAG: radical SAM protein [Candidatus Hecatellales archaeon]|nr:MAG: radical SAM protein [Candidatus Hecatellales archaeon]
MRLRPPKPFSAGILLSYKCTNECRHCMYACSPKWSGDWISPASLERVLSQLAASMCKRYPPGFSQIGVNLGLHFTGGEPFLNFDLLLRAVEAASELGRSGLFVETNCYWCTSDSLVRERLSLLKEAGLKGILISANPFILEGVPWERTERAYRVAREVFGRNVIVYHELFYSQLESLNVKGILPFEEYLQRMVRLNPASLKEALSFPSLLPMGRMPYKLGSLYKRYPAEKFFEASCLGELTREWHVHVDNYCNYIPGYCGGLSLGDAGSLEALCEEGLELEEYPVLQALTRRLGDLYKLAVEEFGYEERAEGYVSKCHLCVDLRRHLARKTSRFKELQPREFYEHLE